MSQELNRLSSSINYARNQSIISSEHIILCSSQSFTACDGNSQWHKGWMVFVDVNRNREFDDNDRILLNENSMTGQLQAMASIYRPMIRFDSMGFAPGTNLSIRFCDERGAEFGKAIIISNVGRPRVVQQIETCG
jgi:type IV fimbrial biogenesis protein FimT